MTQRVTGLRSIVDEWKYPFVILSAYYIFNLLCVGIDGNFPLNDDWMYGFEVRELLSAGQLHLVGGAPSCVVHLVAGAAVCKLFGFSFVVLRLLCLLMSYAAALLLFAIVRQLGGHKQQALCASALLATNPLFVNLSFGYMTDVPALTLSLAYMYLLLKAIKSSKSIFYISAAIALTLAIGTRQNTIVLIGCNAYCAIFLFISKFKRGTDQGNKAVSLEHGYAERWHAREFLFCAILLVLAPIAFGIYLDKLMTIVNFFPGAYDWYKEEIDRLFKLALSKPFSFFFLEAVSTVRAAAYLGLFGCPLLAAVVIPHNWLAPRHPNLAHASVTARNDLIAYGFVSLLVVMGAITYLVIWRGELMPFSVNLWYLEDLGAKTVISQPWHGNACARIICTTVSAIFGWGFLFTILCCAHRSVLNLVRSLRNSGSGFRMRRAIVNCLPIVAASAIFASTVFHSSIINLDRYFLFPFPFAIACCVLALRYLRIRISSVFACLAIGAIGLYSTCAEHDYLSWNRARWAILQDLLSDNVSAADIDGGMEFNYFNDPALNNDIQLGPHEFESIHKGSVNTKKLRGWSINGEHFIISTRPIEGYKIYSQKPFFSMLQFTNANVYALEEDVMLESPIIR